MSFEASDGEALNSLSKFTLFETKSRFYVTASTSDTHRVLKIDRTDPTSLSVTEDGTIYDDAQLDLLLRMVQDGNKSQGGLEKVLEFHGIVGFVKFTSGWYLVLITKRSVVGLLGGHYIYHCDETTLIAVSQKAVRSSQESKAVNTFQSVDLSKNFYFSYSYDITNTLQANLTVSPEHRSWNTRFMWNHHLLAPAFELEEPKGRSRWVLPLIHGFVDQAKIPLFSRTVYVTIIARRSRHYAGARYLTRGANEQGYVANEVESEQIVSEPLATAFGTYSKAFDRRTEYGGYTSFVQYRGSIPVMWHQEVNQMTPRPPIEIPIKDPYYTRAARHFDDLLGRYGSPIYILNLIKSRESQPRESKLLAEYGQCVSYLNQFLPEEHRMRYIAWDMSQAWKRGNDVIGAIEDVCEESMQATKFFHGGPSRSDFSEKRRMTPLLQQGILRTNCVDCLDRTNAAQFAIAKRALGHQLHALGLIGSPIVPFGSDAVDVLNEMYHDHGDTLAWQYTGSALVNRVETYRRTKAGGQWSSHSRDLLENIRRFYNNSMLDADKQAAINLFLGVDHILLANQVQARRPHYRQWFTPSHLEPRRIEEMAAINEVYKEYYKPHILSQFVRLYAFTMNSTSKLHTKLKSDLLTSPFEPKTAELAEALPAERRSARRWAAAWHNSGTGGDRDQADEDHSPFVRDVRDVHPVETLVHGLMDPTDDTIAQRALEYERYLHYHSDDLNASDALVEEKDLQSYIRAVQLSRGEEVERLLQSEYEISYPDYEGDGEGSSREYGDGGGAGNHDNNAAYYENYLRTLDL